MRGLEVDGRLIISPAQGVKFHEAEMKAGLWGAVGSFAMAIFGYFYFKKYYGLDWKLSRKSQWKYPKRSLRSGRRQGRVF